MLGNPIEKVVPQYFSLNKHWRSMLHLFHHHDKLQDYINFVDIERYIVNVSRLKAISKPWSKSEKFMLALALHFFDPRNKIDLYDIEYLDRDNRQLAIEAIRLRYE